MRASKKTLPCAAGAGGDAVVSVSSSLDGNFVVPKYYVVLCLSKLPYFPSLPARREE